jgi:signal recognition particle receptor subunit beta
MSTVNLASQELAIKIVYYGPGLGGKTTSLQYIHRAMRPASRGQLISLATGSDRTLYFDFLPIRLPKLGRYKVRVALYTVPGQVHYNATRKLVLAGSDGIVFVADSQHERMGANVESLRNLADNLVEQGRNIEDIPFVIQYNKRDAPNPTPLADLRAALNPREVPDFETIATTGRGVFDSLKATTTLVLSHLRANAQPAEARRASAVPSLAKRPSAPAPAPPKAEAPEPREQLSAENLSDLAQAIDHIRPATASETGSFSYESEPRSFSQLISSQRVAGAIALAEQSIAAGNWADAVNHVDTGYRKLATKLCGDAEADTFVMAALIAGLPAPRFQRYRELSQRITGGGGVASSDAMFAVFFLTDFALRVQEGA